MLSAENIKQIAGTILDGAAKVHRKEVSEAKLREAMILANQASKVFAHPDCEPNVQTDTLRERLFGVIEESGTLAALIERDGDGLTGGARAARLAELEGEGDYLESLLTRLQGEEIGQ